MSPGTGNYTSKLSIIALSCAVFFILTFFLIHFLRSDLDPLSDTLSVFALGSNGFILELGFYAIAINQLLLAFLLWPQSPASRTRLPSAMLALAGTGALLVGYFPTQINPADFISRLPHITGAIMQFLFFPVSMLLLFTSMPYGAGRSYSKATGMITLVLFIILLVMFFSPAMGNFPYFGLIEKIDILLITVWLIYYPFYIFRSTLD